MSLLKKVVVVLFCLKFIPYFLAKRIFRKKIKINLAIFDMDGTLTMYETFKQALNKIYSDKGKTYEKVIFTSKDGKLTLDNYRMLMGLNYLVNGKFNKKMEVPIVEMALKKINNNLLKILDLLNNNVETIIVTRSSQTGAKILAKELGMSAGYGSIMKYDSKSQLVDAELLITDKVPIGNYYSKFSTKEDAAKNHMKMKLLKFDLSKTVFFSNDILDVDLMSKCGTSILIRKENPEFIDKLAEWLHLYDYLLITESDYERLYQHLRNSLIGE